MGNSSYPTDFTESNALLLIQGGDEEGAWEILLDMSPQELRRLGESAARLETLAARADLLGEHEAGGHEGKTSERGVSSSVYGCPKCHEIAGLRMPK